MTPTFDQIRAQFPALSSDWAFLENAGGSQLPRVVIESMARYMESTYVQIGATYQVSREATGIVNHAHKTASTFVKGDGTGHVILGPSSSQLIRMVADCYGEIWRPGDEVVVAESGHEANINPWLRLEKLGVVIRWWRLDPDRMSQTIELLPPLLNTRTKLVTFPHVSNLLGEVADVTEIAHLVHEVGARVMVDGVAYAPHHAIDVAAWDVDWYVYSTYKVYGPHMAVLYGKSEALSELTGPNHYFIPKDSIPYKFELGGVNHEGCAGIVALEDYLSFVSGSGGKFDRGVVEAAFEHMGVLEQDPTEALLQYLRSKTNLKIVGPPTTGKSRVGTVSFIHSRLSSSEIVAQTDAANIGIRSGSMYANRLCSSLGIDEGDGVVRISLVHYNTVSEVERLIKALDPIL